MDDKKEMKYLKEDLTFKDVIGATCNSVGKVFTDSINYIGEHPVISAIVLVPSVFVYSLIFSMVHDAK